MTRPPRLAEWLLRWLAGPDDGRWVAGDALEEFEKIAQVKGGFKAWRWYWAQTARSLVPLLAARREQRRHASTVMSSGMLPRVSLRHTLRMLRLSPGLTALVVTTLALGIGANTAVFSVIDAVLIQRLPYADPDRLVAIWESTARSSRLSVAPGDLMDFRRDATAFDDIAGYSPTTRTLMRQGPAEQIAGEVVTGNLFALLGTPPALGRTLQPADQDPGAERVVLLSDSIWRRRFASDSGIVGRSIVLDTTSYVVVGVMPPGFRAMTSTANPSFFIPAAFEAEAWSSRDHELLTVGRLRVGITAEQAQADLDRVMASIGRVIPDRDVHVHLAPLARDVVRSVRTSLLVLFGAAGLIVLIACANVASLLLVWSSGKRQEVAVRTALGARGMDIVAQFLATGLVLAAVGGAAGLALGIWTRDILVSIAPASLPRLSEVALNGRILAMAIAVTMLAGTVAGLVPAMQSLRGRVTPGLGEGARGTSGSRSLLRWRGAMLGFEVAAAVVLALGAGLLARSLWLLNAVDLGFETERVLAMTVRLPAIKYSDAQARLRFFDSMRERVQALPGVASAAFANQLPMRGGWGGDIQVIGPAGPIDGEADLQAVSPEYFLTFGIPITRGRALTDADRDGTPLVAVVSQTFVSRWADGRDPIGVQFRRDPASPLVTVVGVVGEVRRDGKFGDVMPQVYFSARQTTLAKAELATMAVRASGDPGGLIDPIRQIVAALDADLTITNVRTLDEILSASVAARRFNSWLLFAFAMLAVTLAMVGVYGVVSHVVTQRTREIGIRIAMGAARRHVIGLVMRGSLTWAAAGLVLGIGLALALSRLLTSMLYATSPTDPATFAAVSLVLMAIAVIASYVPARRAAAGNPLAALRGE